MEDRKLQKRLFLSGMDKRAPHLAAEYGLGLELTHFTWAVRLDEPDAVEEARRQMQGISGFWLHAPFAELCPCAIDPRVRQVAADRFRQTVETAQKLGVDRIVFHAGFIPTVYFPEWFVPQSIEFWKAFLKTVPQNMTLVLENVMEPGPEMLMKIAEGVADRRLGLCLDLGHANCELSREKPEAWIDPMLPYLRHIHLHSNFGANDLHLPLGEGNLSAGKILDRLLAETDVTFTLENQNCEASLAWLKAKGYLEASE
ncbi:MAG: sugar phosphate isomerase/epimerase [Clostridia bacterium]|nr:sugar phosphate isomerase/epimerase [Clostridia bacterium]